MKPIIGFRHGSAPASAHDIRAPMYGTRHAPDCPPARPHSREMRADRGGGGAAHASWQRRRTSPKRRKRDASEE